MRISQIDFEKEEKNINQNLNLKNSLKNKFINDALYSLLCQKWDWNSACKWCLFIGMVAHKNWKKTNDLFYLLSLYSMMQPWMTLWCMDKNSIRKDLKVQFESEK